MDNNYFGKNLRFLRKKFKLSQPQLGDKIGKSESTIQMYEQGKRMPVMGTVTTLSRIFGIPINDIINTDLTTLTSTVEHISDDITFISIPLYDDISCGNGGFVEDTVVDHVNIPSDSLNGDASDYFAQRAKGDSMIDAGINEGDLLVFQKTSFIEDNQIGSFCIDDGIATCKKFKSGKSFIQLIPMNRNYDPIVIDLNDINFRVVGVLKLLIKTF